MEALGGTSAREAPHRGWTAGKPSGRAMHAQPVAEAARTGRTAGFPRRLASLNAGSIVSDLYFGVEVCLLCILGAFAASLCLDAPLTFWTLLEPQSAPYLLVPVGAAVLLKAKGLYEFEHLAAFSSSVSQVLMCTCLAYCPAILVGYGFETGGSPSSVWLASWLLAALPCLAALRALAGWICTRLVQAGAIHQTVAIYDDAGLAQSAVQALSRAKEPVRLAGVFGPHRPGATAPGQRFEGDLEALIKGALADTYDTIIIATDRASSTEIGHLLARLDSLPCAVQIYFSFKNETSGIRRGQAITLFTVQAKPISGWGRLYKRLLDVSLAAAGLLCLAPFLLLVAIAIKLDSPGPVFFTQRRHGLNRKVFRILKLRTMCVMEDGEQAVQAARKDARVTRIGALLRKTSVDELPQLLNVLKGEMSLVGPRPHPLSLDNQYTDQLQIYSSRHKVKPGITGWAQIHGHRGPTDRPGLMQRRVQHDLEYIENWSLWLDVKIIAATPFLGIIHKNAV